MQTTTSFKTLIQKSLLWVWCILCVLLFIIYPGSTSHVHQFFTFENWQDFPLKAARIEPVYYAGNLFVALVGALLFFLAYVSLGFLCLQLTKIITPHKNYRFFERVIFVGTAFLVGRQILSFVFFLLAGLYKITPGYVIAITAISFLIGIRSLGRFLFQRHSQSEDVPLQTDSKFYKFILSLSVLIIFLSLMYSSARLSYDSVAIYFSNAKITAATQHIQFFSNEPLTASAFQEGIQYAAIIQVFGDQAGRIYSWINGLVIILFSLALADQLGLSRRAKIILLILLLTSTAFLDLMGDGKVDLASSAPILAAIYWMAADYKTRTKNILLLIGFLAGMGVISRPYNIFLECIFIGLFYSLGTWAQRENGHFDFKLLLKSALWLAPGIILLFGYLLIANWVIAGNPITPLLGILNYKLSNWDSPFDPNDIWIVRLFYPLVITFLNSSHSLGTISPLFLAFLPGFLIADVRKKIKAASLFKQTLIATTITLILWIVLFFTVLEIRYIFFLWIILFMFGAQIIESALENNQVLFRALFGLTIVVTLFFMAFRTIYISIDTYSPMDGQGVPHCYDSFYCTFLEPVNKIAQPGDRVLALNAYRYYLRPDLFACSSKREEYLILEKLSNQKSDDFWAEVYRQGYKFVTYEENYSKAHLRFGLIPDPQNTPAWLELKPLFTIRQSNGKLQASYQIIATRPPVTVQKACVQIEKGIWEVQPEK